LAGETPAGPTPDDRFAAARRHLELFSELEGDRVALMEMRKHLSWYSKGLPGAAHFRATVNGIDDSARLVGAMESFFHG
jgi:tRNA-dihydrouridine synthase B